MARDERIATSVDKETKSAFRVAAAERDQDMSELLRELVEDFLSEVDEENGNSTHTPQTAD